MQPVQGWVCIQQCNGGWIRLAAWFLVRAKGGSQLARPYSCLTGLRSLPVAPPALLLGCPISVSLAWAPPLSMHWADSGYSYRATWDCQLSLSTLVSPSLSPSSDSVSESPECFPLPPPCPSALLRKSFRWELLLCLLPLSIPDTSKVSPSAYPQGLAFLWLMVYVFHSSLKHKRLISLPCGGQERVRERGKTTLKKNGLYFSALFTFLSRLKFMCCWRLFGTLGVAGLARVVLWTLYVTTTRLQHIEFCKLKPVVKVSVNLIETFFFFSSSVNAVINCQWAKEWN